MDLSELIMKQMQEAFLQRKQDKQLLELFKTYISEKEEDLQIIHNTKTQKNSICGGLVKEGELTLQCFSCAPDPHHMFCHNCFIKEKHKGHKAIQRHNIGGCCDCGDSQTMIKEAFCSKHPGFDSINRQAELAKISDELKLRFRAVLLMKFQKYFELMDCVISKIDNFDQIIVALYHNCCEHGFDEMKKSIEEQTNNSIQDYYQAFYKAVILHKQLFQMIGWLIEDSLPFLYLTTSILTEQTDEGYTIFEGLINRQVYFTENAPFEVYSIEGILFKFHADQEFKRFSQRIFVKNYQKMWRFSYKQDNPYFETFKKINEQIQALSPQQANNLKQDPKITTLFPELIQKYFDQKKTLPNKYRNFSRAEFHEHHTQYISKQFQQELLTNQNFINIYKMCGTLMQELTSTISENSYQSLTCYYIFRLRFEYSYFAEIAFEQLQQVLGDQMYNNLSTQPINQKIIQEFPYEKFLMTALIKSFEQTEPSTIDVFGKPAEIEIWSIFYYIAVESQILSILKSGFSNMLSHGKPQLTRNLSKLYTAQCYQSIKQYRNKYKDPDYKEALEKYLNNENVDNITTFVRINYIYYKNASTVDKFLIFFLTYEYCAGNFQSSKDFRIYLTDLFQEDFDQLQDTFTKILFRCIQNLVCILFGADPRVNDAYIGQQKVNEGEALESYDLVFIKLYIFLFGTESIGVYQEQFASIHSPYAYELSIIILLRILTSDTDIYNVCGAQFTEELPIELQKSLQQTIANQFSMGMYQTYKQIDMFATLLPLSKKQLEKHILTVCELDPHVKQLKLKGNIQTRFDPMLLFNQKYLKSQIVEKIMEKKDENINIQNGNGIDFDIKYPESMTLLRNNVQKIISNESNYSILQELCRNSKDIGKALQLHYIQLKTLYFYHNGYFNQIVDQQISELQMEDRDMEQTQFMIAFLKSTQQMQIEQPIVQEKNSKIGKSKIEAMKAKFAQKHKQFQNSEQYTNLSENINEVQEEQELCYGCKQALNETFEACQPILLEGFPQSNYYDTYPKEILDKLKTQQFNFVQLSLTNCKHAFHKTCLQNAVDVMIQDKNQNLPAYVLLGCPVCKQSYNVQLPIGSGKDYVISQAQVNEFNDWLLNLQYDLGIKEYMKQQYTEDKIDNILGDLYIQIFINLLNQLFLNPKDFIRNDKSKVFQSILKICQVHFKSQVIFKQFEKDQYQFLDIINNIIENVINSPNPQQLNMNFQRIVCSKLSKQQNQIEEFGQVLKKCLNITLETEDNLVLYKPINLDLKSAIYNNLKQMIGTTFDQFYKNQFWKGCSICKFYPLYKNDDLYLCLLCMQLFCQQSCDQRNTNILNQYGNLNRHAQQEHISNSIFISLQTGALALLSSPICIMNYKSLFYDRLGQRINIVEMKTKWEDYFLDEECLSHVADIILFNQYKSILRNYEVKISYLDTQGRI